MEKIKNVPIGSIVPYELNNKIHDQSAVDRVANSISEFGWTYPVLIDEQNIILAGHKRLLAAKKLGLKEVPIIIKEGLTAAQKKAYRIIDNKSSQESSWDLPNIALDLQSLEDAGFDLEPFILKDFEIPGKEQEPQEDDFEAPPVDEVKTDIKRGDIIELGPHRVMCGDSTSAEDVSALMGDKVGQMMFTDPPYGVSYEGGHFHSGDVNIKRKRENLSGDNTNKIYSDFLPVWLKVVDGPFYVFHAGSCPHELYSAINNSQCQIHALLIWHKINAKYAAMNAQYKQRHEPCLYFKPKGSTTRWCGPNDECTVWEEKRDSQNTMHPTQKPIRLAFRAISNHIAELVVDAFLGSGSTLIAADQLNRICYGMEIEPRYCQVIIDRYFKHCETTGKEFDCKINGEPYFG